MNGRQRGEFQKIDRISEIIAGIQGPPNPRVHLGIGDDAAVVASPAGQLLLCTDLMVEQIHFDLKWSSPADLGHKALAACLSDLAAMNGTPLHALFSLALPRATPDSFLEEFYLGAAQLARRFQVEIVGGDLSASPQTIFVDVSCVGSATHPLTRRGARVGDWLAVSGTPGASAAGLTALQQGLTDFPALTQKHLRPVPRFDLLPDLSKAHPTALIDISDGLASETHHLARQSQVGFEIAAAEIPLHPEALRLATALGRSALDWALYGGEDYELLTTLDPAGGVPADFHVIGRAVSAPGVRLVQTNGEKLDLAAKGHDHFG